MPKLNLLHTLSWAVSCLQLARGNTIPRHAVAIERRDVNAEYDFIIAGAGPAGLTVADRLTEDSSVSVLVIEAGPFDQYEDNVLIPGDYPPFQYFWPGLESEPQIGLDNISFSSVCGRVVGGGSAVNAMVYTRGGKEDYSAWVTLGNEGWAWDNMLPYFKKSENFTDPDPTYAAQANISYADDVHGHSGPVQGSYPSYHFPGSENWWRAALDANISQAPDPNGGDNKGAFYMSSFLDPVNGTRSYARINHYDRVKDARPNYHILADTTVAKVLFNGTAAIGVEYLPSAGGNVSQVTATKEVLLAAGGVHTPQVLQLSGIGPRARLESLGVKVLADLPGVGQNLQDHATLTISYNFTNNVTPNQGSLDTNATYRAEQLELYEQQRLGAFTIVHPLSTNIASVALCNATSDCQSIVDEIDSEDPALYLPSDIDSTVLDGYKKQFEITLGQLNSSSSPIGQIHWSTTTTATLYFVKPLSRGTININSTNPLANPVIDWRSMTNPADLDFTLALFRKHRDIFNQPSMRELGPIELSPFGEGIQDDDDIKAVLRQQINPSNAHQCCTAAMLPQDLGGVVDDQLRVYGVQGLRVIDISAWPMIISAAPTATIYGQGEKIADIIKTAYTLA
ncbi:hypothetical protein PFICI_03604 [Pestalotiopsis fici W106-1]|uniref:Glucose-methanol-choline oxidoreductase N-terminal domain-containing protein n=1 Tax=Pestalotiopsis fici (strain W106-1 / CGMCC3.15140) TaxID=1229662 RepID=W3XHV0_PESFW|nr:uncharacterized protein PFICI_03604 [Pestalotiopsis fici W106-1]ETS85579.1 hypothetical protein PFICI_03604 [Pestalotiopsis fici W106-1]